MDYKERYMHALERAKIYKNHCIEIKDNNGIIGELEYIFPELQESEDKQIRKGIIDFLWKEKIFLQEAHSSVENNPKYRFVMDAITWLEKQGEQKPTWNENDERIVTALMEGFRYHQLFNPRFGEVPNAEIISWIKSLKERIS